MSKLKLIVLIISLTLILASGSGAQEPATAPLVNANNGFSVDLYRLLTAEPVNVFVSGYSVTAALDMTFAGARGETAAQMQKTLGLNFDLARLHPMSSALMSSLNSRQGYELSVANSLWGQFDLKFRPEFLGLTEKFYASGFQQANFINMDSRAKARKDINAWVEDKTRQRIKDIIGPDTLSVDTRLVLVNAIYFKAAWAKQFDKSLTQDADFTLANEKKVEVPMMRNTDDFGYAETDKLQILRLPYAQNELAMYIILPKDPAYLANLEAKLTSGQLKSWFNSVQDREVAVTLPKFKIERKYGLNDMLIGLGMRDAFDWNMADFSGMAVLKPNEQLFISKVIHQTFVEVDENGTEAAAATAVVMDKAIAEMNPPKPVEFKADHPFIFAICDNTTGSILFMGRVSDPSRM